MTEPSDDFAVQEILADPDLRAEAVAQLPVLRAQVAQPAGQEGIRDVIGRRFALFPQPDRSAEEWAAWWSDYYDVLADMPFVALEAGMLAWVKAPGSEFMPKPGKLLDLAKATPSPAFKAYNRAKRVAEYRATVDYGEHKPIPMPSFKPMTPTESSAQFVDRAQLPMSAERPKVELPSIAGKPDAGGLTPAMRALIARRGEA